MKIKDKEMTESRFHIEVLSWSLLVIEFIGVLLIEDIMNKIIFCVGFIICIVITICFSILIKVNIEQNRKIIKTLEEKE